MLEQVAVAAFGRQPVTAAIYHGKLLAKSLHQASAPSESKSADKWKILRDLTCAREAFGITGRTIAVLEALLSFYPSQMLTAGNSLVVFPSNQKLSERAKGLSEATLRRHIAILVEKGLVARRDSPNGKRYAHRSREGAIKGAYGFDLSPLLARENEIGQAACQVKEEAQELRRIRSELTVMVREIRKTISWAYECWPSLSSQLDDTLHQLSSCLLPVSRNPKIVEASSAIAQLRSLEHRLSILIEGAEQSAPDPSIHDQASTARLPAGQEASEGTPTKDEDAAPRSRDCGPQEHSASPKKLPSGNSNDFNRLHRSMSGNASQNERHIESKSINHAQEKPRTQPASLSSLLALCPSLRHHNPNGISSLHDLRDAIASARNYCGIHATTWNLVLKALGPMGTCYALCIILNRLEVEQISNPGAYLLQLGKLAERGELDEHKLLQRLHAHHLNMPT